MLKQFHTAIHQSRGFLSSTGRNLLLHRCLNIRRLGKPISRLAGCFDISSQARAEDQSQVFWWVFLASKLFFEPDSLVFTTFFLVVSCNLSKFSKLPSRSSGPSTEVVPTISGVKKPQEELMEKVIRLLQEESMPVQVGAVKKPPSESWKMPSFWPTVNTNKYILS